VIAVVDPARETVRFRTFEPAPDVASLSTFALSVAVPAVAA